MEQEDKKYLKEVYHIETDGLQYTNIYSKKRKRPSQVIGNLIAKLFGVKAAYYTKLYLFDLKAMRKALTEEKGKKQLQFPKKIAIIGVMTNKYINYFPKYYETIKEYFLPNTQKHFFSFTDQLNFPYFKGKNDITIVPTKHLPMPWTMLLTFHHMNRIIPQLKEYSHIIYVDTDMYFQVPVLEKDFFTFPEPLFAVRHHAYVNKQGEFDFSSKSLASVKKGDDLSTYWLASFYGGKRDEAIKMIKEIKRRIDVDIKNNVVARYVDESHLNKYLIDNKDSVHSVSPAYSYPSMKPIPFPFKKTVVHITKTSNISG
jgi:hypothetical protein